MFRALRIRDFRYLWGGGIISSLGSWLLVLAIPVHVFQVTGSLSATGLTMAAEYLPMLGLGPVAGVLADRWDRRRLMIAASLVQAAAVAAMLGGLGPGRYWVFYAALVAENTGGVLAGPALLARIPEVVGTGRGLSSASALNAVGSGTVRLLGGPLGGMLLATAGIRVLICADAASYLVAAGAVALTSRPASRPRPGRAAALRAVRTDLRAGLRALWQQPTARALFGVITAFLAANAALSAVLFPFCLQRLGGTRPAGLVLAALGAGFLLGAPVVRVLLDRAPPRALLAGVLAAAAASYPVLFHAGSLRTALPAAAAVGITGSVALAAGQAVLARTVPNAVLGRIGAVFGAGEAAVTLGGSVAGPQLAQAVRIAGLADLAGLATAAAAVLAWVLIPRQPAVALADSGGTAGPDPAPVDGP
jgi:predicted MFS family arabinose efflux permease